MAPGAEETTERDRKGKGKSGEKGKASYSLRVRGTDEVPTLTDEVGKTQESEQAGISLSGAKQRGIKKTLTKT